MSWKNAALAALLLGSLASVGCNVEDSPTVVNNTANNTTDACDGVTCSEDSCIEVPDGHAPGVTRNRRPGEGFEARPRALTDGGARGQQRCGAHG